VQSVEAAVGRGARIFSKFGANARQYFLKFEIIGISARFDFNAKAPQNRRIRRCLAVRACASPRRGAALRGNPLFTIPRDSLRCAGHEPNAENNRRRGRSATLAFA
jgi:hypothetical protein